MRGGEVDVKHLTFLSILVFEVGKHCIVFDSDCADLFPKCHIILQIIYVDPLIHLIRQHSFVQFSPAQPQSNYQFYH